MGSEQFKWLTVGMAMSLASISTEALAKDKFVPTPAMIEAHTINLPDDYEKIARDAALAGLKDPYSAHIEIGAPIRYRCSHRLFRTKVDGYVWSVPMTVNAKNGFGAYVGEQPYSYQFAPPDFTQYLIGLLAGRFSAPDHCTRVASSNAQSSAAGGTTL